MFYAEGDMETGSKVVLMEDLSLCVQSGFFFGAGNPNNWGKDLEKEVRSLSLAATEVTTLAFSAAAKLHARYWNCNAGLEWLRGAQWLRGKDVASWQASQTRIVTAWTTVKAGMMATEVQWDPFLVDCVDASLGRIDWDTFQAELHARPFTLVHGDFHPANFMVRPDHSLVLVDWEVVGIGSGPQELGQYALSHLEPALRASIERDAVTAYFAEVTSLNSDILMTFEECWDEYVAGGVGRWMWMLPLLASFCPPKATQFFLDQVSAFLRAHSINPSNIPAPRA